MDSAPAPLLTDLLSQVSRSFYTTLRVLPAKVRPQISLAYLLARATDTVADTELVPLDQRLATLGSLRGRILGTSSTPVQFESFLPHQSKAAEQTLLRRAEEAIALLETLSGADRKLVRDVLSTITSGQELDLQRFAGASTESIQSLKTDAELDDYTYRVAGCVGEFWTKICRRHLFPAAAIDEAQLIADGIRFGKGLQLVNILRDIPADLRQGRCYLPAGRLAQAGLEPRLLLDPATERQLRAVYDEYLNVALSHLEAGWQYTNALPRSQIRVRLACAWPILIGVRTINRLRSGNVLDPSQRIKISRAEVRSVLFETLLNFWLPSRWSGLFARTVKRDAVEHALRPGAAAPDNAVA